MGILSDKMVPGPILVFDICIGEFMVGLSDRGLGMEPYSGENTNVWCGVGNSSRGQTVCGLVQVIGGGDILRTEGFSAELNSVFAGRLELRHGPGPVLPSHSGLHHDQLSSGLSLETGISDWQNYP